jgi:hypothetical protein
MTLRPIATRARGLAANVGVGLLKADAAADHLLNHA